MAFIVDLFALAKKFLNFFPILILKLELVLIPGEIELDSISVLIL